MHAASCREVLGLPGGYGLDLGQSGLRDHLVAQVVSYECRVWGLMNAMYPLMLENQILLLLNIEISSVSDANLK